MELSKADLLKLLSYLEGELQARDIVIATLKCEKMKHMLTHGQYKTASHSDPVSALHRDNFAAPSRPLDQTDVIVADNQLSSLENLVSQQRKAQLRMANILKDAELRHRKVVQELIEEKRKHEHDTAQGDDITYGLEKERTRLKQDLEMERLAKKRLEKDIKKISDVSDEDKNRQKQIVLLLLAERKKIVMKYIEERKRSEDLAQILSEEKGRIDSMAEGLEEESKKSLQMEAELEKQLAQFDTESQILRASLLREEKRVKELEAELEKAKNEALLLEKQLVEVQQVAVLQTNAALLSRSSAAQQISTPPRHSTPGWIDSNETCAGQVGLQGNPPMISSLAKVVQPTATVSSVPVCGPTTGVARSISPGQSLRGYCPPTQPTLTPSKVEKRVINNSTLGNSPRAVIPAQKIGTHVTMSGSNGSKAPVSRGIPPPVPPNKPVVPPKKESVLIRRGDPPNLCIASESNSNKCSKEVKPVMSDNQEQQQIHHDHDTYQNVSTPSQSGVV